MKGISIRKLLLYTIDTLIIIASCIFVFFFFSLGEDFEWTQLFARIPLLLVCTFLGRAAFRVYANIWRYADAREYLKLLLADFCACFIFFAVDRLFLNPKLPAIYIAATCMLELIIVICSRLIYKQYLIEIKKEKTSKDRRYIAIVGAGYAGMSLVDELVRDKHGVYAPFCFFDKDSSKRGKLIRGVKVLGTEDEMESLLKNTPVSEIVIAIPSLEIESRKTLINKCLDLGYRVKLYTCPFERSREMIEEEGQALSLRDINIEDLLGRDPVTFDCEPGDSMFFGKSVLVTGGGGSIGSEICRQVAKERPGKLIILDINENGAYDIQQELVSNYSGRLPLAVEIASIREAGKIDCIFERYSPDIVFHAAAHKHVPLMEENCDEAVKNNVFGTLNVINAAEKYGAEKMIIISTDKAVNPTNVMGATKRMCEMIIQSKRNSRTKFAAVRFGNVLGSNGSVVPLFKKQIEKGGPVTLTDRRAVRYFMTIPEAVQLVLQAASMAENAEIYVLDMGEPVRIIDLAEKMIKLSGFRPYEDIDIKEIGLRPGEKLYEELLIKTEELCKTENNKIYIERDGVMTEAQICDKLELLKRALEAGGARAAKTALKIAVPTYKDPGEINTRFLIDIEEEKLKVAQA